MRPIDFIVFLLFFVWVSIKIIKINLINPINRLINYINIFFFLECHVSRNFQQWIPKVRPEFTGNEQEADEDISEALLPDR